MFCVGKCHQEIQKAFERYPKLIFRETYSFVLRRFQCNDISNAHCTYFKSICVKYAIFTNQVYPLGENLALCVFIIIWFEIKSILPLMLLSYQWVLYRVHFIFFGWAASWRNFFFWHSLETNVRLALTTILLLFQHHSSMLDSCYKWDKPLCCENHYISHL